jgi:hypothetical protein
MDLKGRHLIESVAKTIAISDEEIREALAVAAAPGPAGVRVWHFMSRG